MEQYINKALKDLKSKNRIPFHMPGHKRHPFSDDPYTKIYELDITEIQGYDNLHHPEGIIRASMDELKKIYHTRESWYVINGSTAGILSSIASVCDVGDKIIVGRNCHRAVYNIIKLLHLKPVFIYPKYQEELCMMADFKVDEILRIKDLVTTNPDVKAVFLTSPTYEGVVSNIRAIKDVLEPFGIPLIVDEAHGAHFIFHEGFPKSAIECGADLVIQSTHKTLPAATQTALLHLNGELISPDRVFASLATFETSSPSYLMMASVEKAVAFMHREKEKLDKYLTLIHKFRARCGQLEKIKLVSKENVDCYDYDEGKLVFSLVDTEINGNDLFHKLLHEYGIECEMANDAYCIAMTSVFDTKEDFEALLTAIFSIDQELKTRALSQAKPERIAYIKENEAVYEMWECNDKRKELIPLKEACGRISGAFVELYPPDIPLLVPGEKIKQEMVENILSYIYNGYNVPGIFEGSILVLEDK